jgi:hypothetical protein
MWARHGEVNHLLFSLEKEDGYKRLAEEFAKAVGIQMGAAIPLLPPESITKNGLEEKLKAYVILRQYQSDRQTSNFPHHYERARVESEPETVLARKLFHHAEALRLTADLGEAIAVYERPEAIKAWRDKVLLAPGHKEFRRDDLIQEQTYEIELKYLELVNEQLKLRMTRLQPFVPLLPKTSADVFTDWILTKGPFDILVDDQGREVKEGDKGEPLISESTRRTVQSRNANLPKPGAPPPPRSPEKGTP